MKNGKVAIIIGSILIFLQLLSVIGNAKTGININLSFDNFNVFLFDLVCLLSYFLIGIIGIILLISGLYAYKKKTKSIQQKENIPIANRQETLIEEVRLTTSSAKEYSSSSEFCQYCGGKLEIVETGSKKYSSPPNVKVTCDGESLEKSRTADGINSSENKNKPLNILTSKRFAAVVSIILCTAIYLSFLPVFTMERDTYICYTTKTGECFHSATCDYLNTAYETTVYEVSQKYKACKYCNPCVAQYKTTIIDRNYTIPIFISLPISATVFFLLTYKKKGVL